VIVSSRLSDHDQKLLGLAIPLRIDGLAPGHRPYLAWHRAEEFKA